MATRRVVITGLGAVTPLGLNAKAFWQAACEGRSGARPITQFDTKDHGVRFACTVKDFDPAPVVPPREARRVDRHCQFALVAADEAVRDAGLDFALVNTDRCGVIVGSGIGGLRELEDEQTLLLQRGPSRVSPYTIPKLMPNAAAGLIGIRHGLRGPNFGAVSACASATNCLSDAFLYIASDLADVIISGGTESAVTPLGMAGFIACRALSTRNDAPEKASRPFDLDRDGFVMGEGAGILVFEELEHAKARGAHIYAEVLGFGATCDAHHITAPDPEGRGAAGSMSLALRTAGLQPADVDYINAHGTSTPLNDAMETHAIKLALGEAARSVAISSTKSMIGHLLGASGGAEMVITALTIEKGIITPTINYETPDPQCDLDYVPNVARERPVRIALCNSFGFGGHNVSIAVGRFTG